MEKKLPKKAEKMNIYLCGFSFSGKTSAGYELSRLTKRKFIDTDKLIKKRLQISPEKLIISGREKLLRKEEKKIFEEICGLKNYVIAMGAGMLPSAKWLKKAQKNGICVFLDRDFSQIETQIKKNDGGRPLLRGKTFKQRRLKAEKLYSKRVKYYSRAKIRIRFKRFHALAVAVKIKRALNEI